MLVAAELFSLCARRRPCRRWPPLFSTGPRAHPTPPHPTLARRCAAQVLWATFRPASTSLLPCQLTLAAGCTLAALEAAGRLPRALRGLWAATSAWTATALFMLQPVSQLVVNFTVG